MKTRHFLSCLLAFTLILAFMVTTAYALPHLVGDEAFVYVNDDIVEDIVAYTDGHGVVRLESPMDLAKVFPELIAEPDPNGESGIILVEWVTYFGFTYHQEGNSLYIFTEPNVTPLPDDDEPDEPDEPEEPDEPRDTNVEVFVNGLKVENPGVHKYMGEVFVDEYASLTKIFGSPLYLAEALSNSSLRFWAEVLGYTLIANGEKVYLNNDGSVPVEVTLNGKLINFPDQQPFIVDNRTLIPIRSVAELIQCDVEWDATSRRVRLEKSDKVMLLWIDHNRYWSDGAYNDIDVGPTIINGRTMVPVRLITEFFGYQVNWDTTGPVGTVRLAS